MCVLLILKNRVEGWPWVVAANRDEAYARPSRPPRSVRGPIRFFAGSDRTAGGTWLGVNEKGLIAAITNRPGGDRNPERPSRGQVTVAVLMQPDAAAARSYLEDLEQDVTPWRISSLSEDRDLHVVEAPLSGPPTPGYNPFNLFVAHGDDGFVTYNSGGTRVQDVDEGVHILTNDHDLDQLPVDPTLDRTWSVAERGDLIDSLKQFLARHEDAICKHGEEYGTVSSSIVTVGPDFPRDSLYLHAEGSPCTTPFTSYKNN